LSQSPGRRHAQSENHAATQQDLAPGVIEHRRRIARIADELIGQVDPLPRHFKPLVDAGTDLRIDIEGAVLAFNIIVVVPRNPRQEARKVNPRCARAEFAAALTEHGIP
jgi:hypothetical protein